MIKILTILGVLLAALPTLASEKIGEGTTQCRVWIDPTDGFQSEGPDCPEYLNELTVTKRV